MTYNCAVCGSLARFWREVDGYAFTDCEHCGSIALNQDALCGIDSGQPLRNYDGDYWSDEIRAATERCWGGSIARAAEAILLCQRPINKFVDIGSGSGELLDSLSFYLPTSQSRFYGVEMFPPMEHTRHNGFIKSSLDQVAMTFDCGVCIEVIEHLTPNMLNSLIRSLAKISAPDSFYIFNTGLADFVRAGNSDYIDPIRRGHIVSYGWRAIQTMFSSQGFEVHRLGNRDWAFAVEFRPTANTDINSRIWHPKDENLSMLTDPRSGSVMHILARESFRAYEN